jgi:hypothetical protein
VLFRDEDGDKIPEESMKIFTPVRNPNLAF